MKNRLSIIVLSICLVFCSFNMAFAEGATNIDTRYMNDYSIETEINNDVFNPGEFTVELALNAVDWLGVSGKSTSVTFKTGASAVSLSKKLPNLSHFVMAEEIAKASMAGNTFLCSKVPGISWNGKTGKWKTIINAPTEKIKYALDNLREYLTITNPGMRTSTESKFPAFFDNMIMIKAGTSIQYGNTVITFTKDCEIDELYDKYNQSYYYESTFAENIFRIKEATQTESVEGNTIALNIAKNSYLQCCEKKFLAKDDIRMSIENAETGSSDPLSELSKALETAQKTDEAYKDENNKWMNTHSDDYSDNGDIHPAKSYYVHKCDANAVFDSGFGLVNELLGVFTQSDAKIVVISDGGEATEVEERQPDQDATVAAELKISSAEATLPCTHEKTVIKDAVKPTVTTVGYSGDTYCADCGKLMKEGEIIAKLPSSIKLKYASLTLKTGQTTTAEKVTFVKGDSIKTVTSSNKNIVKASKSGSNGVKLTAGTKTGTAKVTVKLAGGKSAVITVKVQKSEVACTGLSVTSGISVKLKKGKTHQIKVTRKPVTCVQKITYKTSNKKVATVTSKGKVKAIKKGTAKITIKCGKKTKTVKITVK